jgi:hypothetical protein
VAEISSPLFTREDWTLLRTVPGVCQVAGVPPERLRRLVFKELADNGLDVGNCSGGEYGDGGYAIEDDGPGMPPELAPHLFSIRRPLTSSKLLRLPTRGALGNGLRVVAGAVLASGGRLEVWTRNQHLRLFPRDNGETVVEATAADFSRGTRVCVWLGSRIPSDPHADSWARQAIALAGGEVYHGKSSPHWYDADSFFELCQAAGAQTVRDLVANLDGCTGGRAGQIAAPWKGRLAASLTRIETEALDAAACGASKSVSAERLGALGADLFPGYIYARATDTMVHGAGRGQAAASIPYVVEVWAGRAGDRCDGARWAVNRTPITGEIFCYREPKKKTALVVSGCGLYHAAEVGGEALELQVSVLTPYMPITTDGKAPNLEPIGETILEVVERAARKLRRSAPRSVARLSQKDVILGSLDAAIAQASGDGTHRYSLRQLYYAVRPHLLAAFGKEPDYGTFG